jgi:protein-S-isoprenylcysteine O-methyltransferase Ste14
VLFILLPVVPVGTWPLTVQLPLGLGAGGLFLGIGGIVHLGSNLTPLPHPPDDSYLVTTGVYRLVRHPIYASVLFLALAYALWHMSLWHGIGVLGLGWFFDRKATQEEQWLTAKFPEYTAYQAAVKKLLPGIY